MGIIQQSFNKLLWSAFNVFARIRGSNDSKHADLEVRDVVFEEMKQILPLSDRSIVLDGGCGSGYLVQKLQEVCHSAYGVDFVKRFNDSNNVLFQADIRNMPFDDDTFDVSICYGVIHYVGDFSEAKAAVSELARVTKKNGVILIGEVPIMRGYFNEYIKRSQMPVFKKFFLLCYLNSIFYKYFVFSKSQWHTLFTDLGWKVKVLPQDPRMPYSKNVCHYYLTR